MVYPLKITSPRATKLCLVTSRTAISAHEEDIYVKLVLDSVCIGGEQKVRTQYQASRFHASF